MNEYPIIAGAEIRGYQAENANFSAGDGGSKFLGTSMNKCLRTENVGNC